MSIIVNDINLSKLLSLNIFQKCNNLLQLNRQLGNDNIEIINLIGYKATGGIFDDYYPYKNLFSLSNLKKYFCSLRLEGKNINTFAFLSQNPHSNKIIYIYSLQDFMKINQKIEFDQKKFLLFFRLIQSKSKDEILKGEYNKAEAGILYDSHLIEFNMTSNNYFCISRALISNKGAYSRPVMTIAIFIMDENKLSDKHKALLSQLDSVTSKIQLEALIHENQII